MLTSYEVDIDTADGAMNTFVAYPEGSAAYPAIFMYMPSSGIRDELRDMAKRLAGKGYAVFLPNVYYRMVRAVDIDANRLFDDDYAPVKTFMNALNNGYGNKDAISDTAAMIEFADDQPFVKSGPIGVVGYCMGGRLALSAAGAFPARISAMASLYGGKLVTDAPDSPHLATADIRGELYFGIAENDAYVPMTMNDQLRDYLDRVGANYRMEIYAGTEHGFCFPKRYCYAPEADARHFAAITDLFKRRLSA